MVVGIHDGVAVFNDALSNEFMYNVKPYFPTITLPDRAVATPVPSEMGIAFDSEGNFYLGYDGIKFFEASEQTELSTPFAKFSGAGEIITEMIGGENFTSLAIDVSSNDVYADQETGVAAFAPSGSPIEQFGEAQMETSEGIAVNSSTGMVYTSNAASQQIDVFGSYLVPDATTGSVSHFTETSVTVSGSVDPDGLPVTSCVFEYGTSSSYGQSVSCSPGPGSSSGPVAVRAELTGLERLTEYHFRVNISNANGSNQSQDRTFVTPEPVLLSEESISDVSSDSALLGVDVNPHGSQTTYSFEYGTSTSYGESLPIPAGDLGAGRNR